MGSSPIGRFMTCYVAEADITQDHLNVDHLSPSWFRRQLNFPRCAGYGYFAMDRHQQSSVTDFFSGNLTRVEHRRIVLSPMMCQLPTPPAERPLPSTDTSPPFRRQGRGLSLSGCSSVWKSAWFGTRGTAGSNPVTQTDNERGSMSKFQVGDIVQMPGVPFRLTVLEIGVCNDEREEPTLSCPLGSEVFRFKDPVTGENDWMHSSEFEKVR